MGRRPQISLRDLFYATFCAAVGFTLTKSFIEAIEPAVQVALVIGLLQQIRQLASWNPQPAEAFRFSRQFAISWRITIIFLIVMLQVFQLLLAREVIEYPGGDEILAFDPLSDGLLKLCTFIAIQSCVTRYTNVASDHYRRDARIVAVWVLGLSLALPMLIEGGILAALVHQAVEGVEKAQRFRRPGVYIPLSENFYAPLWFGLLAMLSLLASTLQLPSLVHQWDASNKAYYKMLAFGALLVIPFVFVVWFYGREFHRLSPDLADVGLALTAVPAIAGLMLAGLLIAAGAYRAARLPASQAVIPAPGEKENRLAFHETFIGMSLLSLYACYLVGTTVMEFVGYDSMFGSPTLIRYLTMLVYPTLLLSFGTTFAVLELCWRRWRYGAPPELTLFEVPKSKFYCAFVFLAALVAIAIPAIRAFAFMLWLTPINFRAMLGY